MHTRRPLPHQQQQPQRDRVAQLQQQAGSSDFQPQAGSFARRVQAGDDPRVAQRERSGPR